MEADVAFSDSDVVFSLFTPFSVGRATIRARTSGVLLVAGVGSYCAYRICSNFLGNRFVWELLETSSLDRIPSADRRLLRGYIDEVDERDETEDENDVDRRVQHDDDDEDARSACSRTPSQVSLARLSRIRRSTRGRGLYALANVGQRRVGVVSRQSSHTLSRKSSSSIPCSIGSNKSASLRILWEGEQDWDDEFAGQGGTSSSVVRRLGGNVPSTSSLHRRCDENVSVGDLGSVFNDVMSLTSAVEHPDALLDDVDSEEDEVTDNAWLQRMTSSKYMYESVVLASDCGSSGASPSHSFGRRVEAGDSDEPMTLSTNENPLTRSSNSKRSSGRMYDSAIGGEISSNDGSMFDSSQRFGVMPEIDAVSVAASCASLEWCDEGLRQNLELAELDDDGNDVEASAPLRRANLDWDLDSECSPSSVPSMPRDVNCAFAPTDSRDLMVLGCELFQPFSPPFKSIQNLYHRRRLKRIGAVRDDEPASLLHALIGCALYHKCVLLKDTAWGGLQRRFDAAMSECDFLRKWPSRNEVALKRSIRSLLQLSVDPSTPATDEHVEGLQVLLVLEAKRVYDEGLAGLFFDWFALDSPADLMRLFAARRPVPPQVLWNLVCRVCAVNVELHDVRRMSEAASTRVFASPSAAATTTLVWLQHTAVPMPLFFIPDE